MKLLSSLFYHTLRDADRFIEKAIHLSVINGGQKMQAKNMQVQFMQCS